MNDNVFFGRKVGVLVLCLSDLSYTYLILKGSTISTRIGLLNLEMSIRSFHPYGLMGMCQKYSVRRFSTTLAQLFKTIRIMITGERYYASGISILLTVRKYGTFPFQNGN